MNDDLESSPGPPVDPVAGEDKRRARQLCEHCDPPKMVGNLPSHLAQKHGIRGNNEGRQRRDRAPRSQAPAGLPIRLQMQAIYEIAAQAWMVKDPFCAGVLMNMAPMLGAQWEQTCKANPALERFIGSLAGGGSIVTLVAAHAPLFVAIMTHHGPAAQAQRRAEEQAWMEQAAAAAANGEMPEGWIPPGGVSTDEAYGAHAPGSADAAR